MSTIKGKNPNTSDLKYNSAKNAGILGGQTSRENKQKRIVAYNLNPKQCMQCHIPISYEKRTNKFCSKSCAAKYNVPKIISNIEIQEKRSKNISEAFLKKYADGYKPSHQGFCNITLRHCCICEKPFYTRPWVKKKTCSSECRNELFHNTSFETKYHFNQYQNKIILLESGWEIQLAEWLDLNNISWIRPSAIPWVDNSNKNHKYYPDFYLPDFNVYLDPKNPMVIAKDKQKLEAITKIISLFYGNVDNIIEEISYLLK